MTGSAKYVGLFIATVISICPALLAEEPQASKSDLQFEVPQGLFGASQFHPPSVPPGVPLMTHVADFKLKRAIPSASASPDYRRWQPTIEDATRELLETPAGQATSREQKQWPVNLPLARTFATTRDQTLLRGTQPLRVAPASGTDEVRIWAVSEADARKLVEAFLQWGELKARQVRERAEKELADSRAALAKYEKELSQLEPKVKAEREERDQLRTVIAYDAGDAARDILELDKALRAVAIDMSSIQAKVEAIQKLRSKDHSDVTPPALEQMYAFLNQMSATQDIELAGVLARKSALEAERKKAVHFRDLSNQTDQDISRLRWLEAWIGDSKSRISMREQDLANPPDSMRPLEIDGKITIYRVAPPPATSGPKPPAK